MSNSAATVAMIQSGAEPTINGQSPPIGANAPWGRAAKDRPWEVVTDDSVFVGYRRRADGARASRYKKDKGGFVR